MQILIHTMDGSLFPDANPLATVWAGPPTELLTVQCLLYASLAISFLAAFVAMLGKQWINRYIRNCGGSTEEKSWDRQRKLDGMEQWHFHIVMEGPPVMLQVALILLACGLSLYLWLINRFVAGVVITVALSGFGFYAILALVAAFAYNCPYQTPPSLAIRSLVRYISRRHGGVVNTLNSARISTTRLFKHLRSGIFTLWRVPSPMAIPEDSPLATLIEPIRTFHDVLTDWTNHESDARCVAWLLSSITDKDAILSSVQFAADIIIYPAIAKTFPPHLLADLLLECILEGEVVPGRADQACSAGMALASVLSVQLCLDPECKHLRRLIQRVTRTISRLQLDDPTMTLVANALCLLAGPLTTPPHMHHFDPKYPLDNRMPELSRLRGLENITCAFKCWMGRILLQTVWRWRQLSDPNVIIDMSKIGVFFTVLLKNKDSIPTAIRTTVVLTLAVALGQTVTLDDLYVPDTECALSFLHNVVQ